MQRILIICDDLISTASLQESLQLRPCVIEIAQGDADALHHLRQSAFDVVLTSPRSTVKEDLALVEEMEAIRPGLKTIIGSSRSGSILVTYRISRDSVERHGARSRLRS